MTSKTSGDEKTGTLALVLGGGGAHAAYQVGFLRALARHYPALEVPVLTGVSAGAINAVFLANHSGPFSAAVGDLDAMWRNLSIDQVFRSDSLSLLRKIFHWQISLASGGMIRTPSVGGLVDSGPLQNLLEQQFSTGVGSLSGIESNIEQGRLKAVAVTATDYRTDRAVTWVQGREYETWQRTHRYSVSTRLTIEHIMASSALPLLFPAIRIQENWFGDGGMRQSSPLSPALHLGADRILAVSTRYDPRPDENLGRAATDQPPPAQVIGTVLGSIFLDLLVQDARSLRRINQLVRSLPAEEKQGFREIGLFLLQPSCDIDALSGRFRHHLPGLFHYLARGLGTHKILSPHWLSLIMFDTRYLQRLMEIGAADAERRMEDIAALIETGRTGAARPAELRPS